MDNQSSNPDQQSDEQGAQPKPSPQSARRRHREGKGKDRIETGRKRTAAGRGAQITRRSEPVIVTGRNRVPARSLIATD